MTKPELISALESGDVNSIINFALMNNPDALITSLKVAGFKDVVTYDDAKAVMLTLYSQGNADDFVKILNAVPYLNDVPNDTGGLEPYFLGKLSADARAQYDAHKMVAARETPDATTPTDTTSKGNLWLSIGSGVVGIVGSIFGAKQAVSQATLAEQQKQAQAAQTKKIALIAGSVLAGIIILFVGFYLLRKGGK